MKRTIWYPNGHHYDPAGTTDLLSRHRPALGEQQEYKHECRATQYVQQIASGLHVGLTNAISRIPKQMRRDQSQTDKFTEQAESK